MRKETFKMIVMILVGITLGSSVIGSSVSVVNASENSPIEFTKTEDMSKYYTKTYDPKTNTTTVTVSDSQYVQYLLDHGVKEGNIPSELKTRSSRSLVHAKWYGRHHNGNLNIYVSARALRYKDIAMFVFHFVLSLLAAYGEDYREAAGQIYESVKSIADGFHTHHGREYIIRHWIYRGNRVW